MQLVPQATSIGLSDRLHKVTPEDAQGNLWRRSSHFPNMVRMIQHAGDSLLFHDTIPYYDSSMNAQYSGYSDESS